MKSLEIETQEAIEEFARDEEVRAHIYQIEDYRNPDISYKQITDFPIDIFPKEIKEFGEKASESAKAPIDFFGAAMLATASVLIGKQYQIWTKSDKSFFASIWHIGIGKSGSGKSDLERKAANPAFAIQKKYKQEYDQALKEYKQQAKQSDDTDEELEMPILKQKIASNATIEALKDLLEEDDILLYVDELAGWIKAMGQYKKGSSGEQEEFISISDNHTVMVNRKGLRQQIDNPFMAVIGGIQPSKLEEILTSILISDDGFLERFLPCFPNEMPAEYNPNGADPIYEQKYIEYMNRLLTLNTEGFTKNIVLDSEAKKAFDEYMFLNTNEINSDGFDERLDSYWRKTFKNLSRLVLIMHMIYVASGEIDEKEVSAFTVKAAIQLMNYFKNHFAKMVRYVLGNPQEKKYETLCAYIMKYGGFISVRKLRSAKKFGDTPQCRDLLDELALAGLGVWIDIDGKKNDFQLHKK